VPDGQPVRWALNLLHGTALSDRVYGPELMRQLCGRAEQQELPVFFYGSTPEVLARLQQNLRRAFPGLRIAGAEASRFRLLSEKEKAEVAERIRASGAALVFVGLGCPRQEVWTYEHRAELAMPVVAVGAAFDFHAGVLPQAPPALQRMGLEWLFRLAQEPRRLWKRYALLNPLYVLLIGLQAVGLRNSDAADSHPPQFDVRYG
jgi:N-acetylglucosaminyldiphosphoundecaprenol N-acetyl-beta-D-mannosaminyltransferase